MQIGGRQACSRRSRWDIHTAKRSGPIQEEAGTGIMMSRTERCRREQIVRGASGLSTRGALIYT
eukprot:scaffold435612_cov42-Prasinocladus_malaysianus.AAC.1